jgi:hypothetical protein
MVIQVNSDQGEGRDLKCCMQGYRLKVAKREIFDRSDFPDFYTIKSLRVVDFGVKKKKKFTNI